VESVGALFVGLQFSVYEHDDVMMIMMMMMMMKRIPVVYAPSRNYKLLGILYFYR